MNTEGTSVPALAPAPKGEDYLGGVELAQKFYAAHEMEMKRASQQTQPDKRYFDYSAERFDDWLVAIDQFPQAVRNTKDSVEKRGLVQQRHMLRGRLNTPARSGVELPRPFSIEARARNWRIVLGERYVQERPKHDADGIARVYEYVSRDVERLKRLLTDDEEANREGSPLSYLSDNERMMLLSQVTTLGVFVFTGAQQLQMLSYEIESGRNIDLRKLGAAMTRLLEESFVNKARPRQSGRLKGTNKPKSA